MLVCTTPLAAIAYEAGLEDHRGCHRPAYHRRASYLNNSAADLNVQGDHADRVEGQFSGRKDINIPSHPSRKRVCLALSLERAMQCILTPARIDELA